MRDTIGLFYNRTDTRVGHMTGCQKLLNNLLKGLEKIGCKVENNVGKHMCGTLSGGTRQFHTRSLPAHCVIGPEICVLPSEMAWAFDSYKHWIQPSKWVVQYMSQFERYVRGVTFHIWAGGIDTEEFNPDNRGKGARVGRPYLYDCFIYFKDVTKQVSKIDLNRVVKKVQSMGLRHIILSYGSYTEQQYRDAINTSRFGIFVTGTESQGIAYMEALSMGCPLFIIDMNTFLYGRYSYTHKDKEICPSAAPYWDDRCGIKDNDINRLGEFVSQLDSYNPRQYILDNHTLEISAQNYVKILKEVRDGRA